MQVQENNEFTGSSDPYIYALRAKPYMGPIGLHKVPEVILASGTKSSYAYFTDSAVCGRVCP